MLSFDIQFEIIKRIPVKSVIQFRSVCKAWKSFIDCSEFITGYNFCHTQSQHLVLRYKIGNWQKHEVKYVSFVDDDSFPQQKFALIVPSLVKVTRIIDSSHGLLCLIGYVGDLEDSSSTQMAVLWNPAIRKSIAVVVPDHVVHRTFDYIIGFGVCPDTKDPKLVMITYININDNYGEMESISCIPFQVMVFTLSSGEWRCLCSSNLPRKSIQFTCCQAVIGKFIYWIAYDRLVVDGEYRNVIMSFDMSTQEFREIDLPEYMDESPSFISKLRESLVVAEYSHVVKRVCNVWKMEHGDSKAFTKLFTINLPNASVLSTLGFRKSGEPIVEMLNQNQDFDTPCPLVVYEPCSEHIKDLGICGRLFSFFATSYTESLPLLNYDDGHIVKSGAVKR